jgi:hypothetical protein
MATVRMFREIHKFLRGRERNFHVIQQWPRERARRAVGEF